MDCKKLITLLFLIFIITTNVFTQVYLNSSKSNEKRIEDLIDRMTLKEKVGQMCQYTRATLYDNISDRDLTRMVKEGKVGSILNIRDLEVIRELQEKAMDSRLSIPLIIGIDAIHGNALISGATVYPTPLSLASTWDPELVEKIGEQTALETRAAGIHWSFAPNVEVARDPRWGRVGETFGEDPLLVSEMGGAMIRGLQGISSERDNRVVGCAKHFIAGSEPINGLNFAPTDISERTLREIFLPPFVRSIKEGAFSFMAAHNEVNGIPCHADKWLLTKLLRNELGFDGFVVSDWTDVGRLATLHRVASDMKESTKLTVDAGLDMNMHGPGFFESIIELVDEGKLTEQRINKSARRILRAKFEFGLFEKPYGNKDKRNALMRSDEHVKTALKAARESIILLKNESILPLEEKYDKSILVTGPNANNSTILGDWVFEQPEENVTTIYEGIKKIAPEKTDVKFCNVGENYHNLSDSKLKKAKKMAINSDAAVVVVGGNSLRYKDDKTCGENMARSNIQLVGKQLELVKSIHSSGTEVIVVLVNGRPLGVTWIAENIPAIIECWEPGSEGGTALAEIIFGEINPSGKLPITIPRNVGQIQMIYNRKSTHNFRNYYETPSIPLYPFGYGLSYSEFKYSDLQVDKSTINPKDSTVVEVKIENTGDRSGTEIVQIYLRDEVSSVTRPVKELKAFKRVKLEPGQSKIIKFVIGFKELAFHNRNLKYIVEPGKFKVMVGSSSRNEDLLSEYLFVK